MFDPDHQVDVPAVAVKLRFTTQAGKTYEGTGFHVEHADRAWLITCRHNIEDRLDGFIGVNDLIHMELVGESRIVFDDARSVVGIRVDGVIPDCAAIELSPGEWSHTPKFATDIHMTMSGALPTTVNLRAPPPMTEMVSFKPSGWVFMQGFAGGSDQPTTLRGVRLAPLRSSLEPCMVAFLPPPVKGFSGGPVLDVTATHMSLLGITTHRDKVWMKTGMDDGRTAEIQLTAGVCMPIAPLLWALRQTGPGLAIVDVPAPQTPVRP